jgi:hypothetical protein
MLLSAMSITYPKIDSVPQLLHCSRNSASESQWRTSEVCQAGSRKPHRVDGRHDGLVSGLIRGRQPQVVCSVWYECVPFAAFVPNKACVVRQNPTLGLRGSLSASTTIPARSLSNLAGQRRVTCASSQRKRTGCRIKTALPLLHYKPYASKSKIELISGKVSGRHSNSCSDSSRYPSRSCAIDTNRGSPSSLRKHRSSGRPGCFQLYSA